jgi:hypothetical protein
MTKDIESSLTVAGDLSASTGDFRELIQKKLAEKKNQLGETEESIKKYVRPIVNAMQPPLVPEGAGGAEALAPSQQPMARYEFNFFQ